MDRVMAVDPSAVRPLPPAPTSVATQIGQPAFGTYVGELPRVELGKLEPPHGVSLPLRLLRRKKWQYQLVTTPEVVGLFAVVDLGYTSSAFAVVVDLARKRPLFDKSFMQVPGPLVRVSNEPAEGLAVHFRTAGARLGVERESGQDHYRLECEVWDVPLPRRAVRWHGELLAAGAAPALTVIAPVQGGGVNVTQKRAGMLASGKLVVGGRTFHLDGGVGGMDYTQGYMARRTAWRWAMAAGRLPDGTALGLNLVEGFNDEREDTSENALWVGGQLVPLGRARFQFNKRDPLDTWHVRTVDGAVDLQFRPVHAHREHKDFKLVKSSFLQPVGIFEGTIRLADRVVDVRVPGVTEDQDILW